MARRLAPRPARGQAGIAATEGSEPPFPWQRGWPGLSSLVEAVMDDD
jgi:hypothetical protein